MYWPPDDIDPGQYDADWVGGSATNYPVLFEIWLRASSPDIYDPLYPYLGPLQSYDPTRPFDLTDPDLAERSLRFGWTAPPSAGSTRFGGRLQLDSLFVAPVPEPSTGLLVGLGVGGSGRTPLPTGTSSGSTTLHSLEEWSLIQS